MQGQRAKVAAAMTGEASALGVRTLRSSSIKDASERRRERRARQRLRSTFWYLDGPEPGPSPFMHSLELGSELAAVR